MIALAETHFRTTPITGNGIEYILLGVGALITLTLLVIFIVVMLRSRRKQ